MATKGNATELHSGFTPFILILAGPIISAVENSGKSHASPARLFFLASYAQQNFAPAFPLPIRF